MNTKAYIFIAVIAFITAGCANMAPLGGGPKDEKPPVLISTEPADNSINFTGDRVSFVFDEFIQLKNAQQKLLVSPPMKEAPELRAKNRELVVVFKSELEANTTYTLNFGDAIADLNEGNPIQNFIFTFSTGTTVDSLKASGRVINSFTLEPEKNVSVFLYSEKRDSLPYVGVPYYVTRTDNNGQFNFINVKTGYYHIVAVNDKNNNYRVDPPGESIAFLSRNIFPEMEVVDDSSSADTVPSVKKYRYKPDSLLLFSFSDEIPKQKINKSTRVSATRADINFVRESVVKPSAKCISRSDKQWTCGYSQKNDSLVLWAPDTVTFSTADTVLFEIKYGYDSLGNNIFKTDTVKILPFVAKKKVVQNKSNTAILNYNIQAGGKLHPTSRLFVAASSPIKDFIKEKLVLAEMNADSQFIPVPFAVLTDSINPCRLYINAKLNPGSHYRLTVLKGFVNVLHSATNDSTGLSFSVNPVENYGNLKITTENSPLKSCFILTDEKGNPKFTWKNDSVKLFSYLAPGKYKLMLFIDENGNSRWDTGRYLADRQPEKVIRYEKEINIRANWDLEVTWTIDEKVNGKSD